MRRRTQVINGVEYVYEDQPFWDSEKKRGSHKRVYIGKNVDGVFIPNKQFKLQQELEELKAGPQSEPKPGPDPAKECQRAFFGATYLLHEIATKTGVSEDLKKCFPQDDQKILSLAYYLTLEGRNPLLRFSHWSTSHHHPHGRDLPPQQISELFSSIDESAIMAFFKEQSRRRVEKEYLAYHTSSISSCTQILNQLNYATSQEYDPLAQIHLALLFDQTTSLPLCYRKLSGPISDAKTITQLLKELEVMAITKVNLVLDQRFFREDNLNALFAHHHPFLIPAKPSLPFIQQKIQEIRDGFSSRANYHSNTNLYIRSFTLDWSCTQIQPRSEEQVKPGSEAQVKPGSEAQRKPGSEEQGKGDQRIYVHVYYNDQHATDEKLRLNKQLDVLEEELTTGKGTAEHEPLYKKYFQIINVPGRADRIQAKQAAMDNALEDCGYFVLLSNACKDPVEALEIHRAKDLIEESFSNLKERLSMRRDSVSSEESLEGKLFVQFIALIFMSYIKKAMDQAGLFSNMTMQELMDDLDVIELFQLPGQRPQLGEITEKQKQLYAALAVECPK